MFRMIISSPPFREMPTFPISSCQGNLVAFQKWVFWLQKLMHYMEGEKPNQTNHVFHLPGSCW